jgi:TPR repeat protein
MWAGDFYYTAASAFRAISISARVVSIGGRARRPRAAFNVGRMYFFGEGVVTNHEEAATWFRQALPPIRRRRADGDPG